MRVVSEFRQHLFDLQLGSHPSRLDLLLPVQVAGLEDSLPPFADRIVARRSRISPELLVIFRSNFLQQTHHSIPDHRLRRLLNGIIHK